jgi:predicted outer membrane protein
MYATLLVLAVLAADPVAPAAEEIKPDPQKQIQDTIANGINQLEAANKITEKKEQIKAYEALLKQFAHPDELKNMLSTKTMSELAEGFGGRNAKDLLVVLKEIKGRQPKLNADGTKATFPLDIDGVPHKEIAFERFGDSWYLHN